MMTRLFFLIMVFFMAVVVNAQPYKVEMRLGWMKPSSSFLPVKNTLGAIQSGVAFKWQGSDSFVVSPELNYIVFVDQNELNSSSAWSPRFSVEFDSLFYRKSMTLSIGYRAFFFRHTTMLKDIKGNNIDYTNAWTQHGLSLGLSKSLGQKWSLYANVVRLLRDEKYTWTTNSAYALELGCKYDLGKISPKNSMPRDSSVLFYMNAAISSWNYIDYHQDEFSATVFEPRLGLAIEPRRFIGLFAEVGALFSSDLSRINVSGERIFLPGTKALKGLLGCSVQVPVDEQVVLVGRGGYSFFKFGSINKVNPYANEMAPYATGGFGQVGIRVNNKIEPYIAISRSRFSNTIFKSNNESYSGKLKSLELGIRVFLKK